MVSETVREDAALVESEHVVRERFVLTDDASSHRSVTGCVARQQLGGVDRDVDQAVTVVEHFIAWRSDDDR